MKDNFLNKKLKYVYWDVCSYIAIACIVVFILTNVINLSVKGIPLFYWLALVPSFVSHGYVWQYFTYMFVHGSPMHLLLNVYALYVFGKNFERSFGSLEFLLLFFLSGVLGGVLSVLIYRLTGLANVAVIGASGAIYALLFMQSVLYPNLRLLLFFVFPVKIPVAMIIFITVEIVSQLVGPGSGVAHLVHLSSIAIAWVYCLLRLRISPWKVWRDQL